MGERYKKFLSFKNYHRIVQNRNEWNSLQETFALDGPRVIVTLFKCNVNHKYKNTSCNRIRIKVVNRKKKKI